MVTIGQCGEGLSVGVGGDNLFVGHHPGRGIVDLCGEGTGSDHHTHTFTHQHRHTEENKTATHNSIKNTTQQISTQNECGIITHRGEKKERKRKTVKQKNESIGGKNETTAVSGGEAKNIYIFFNMSDWSSGSRPAQQNPP